MAYLNEIERFSKNSFNLFNTTFNVPFNKPARQHDSWKINATKKPRVIEEESNISFE